VKYILLIILLLIIPICGSATEMNLDLPQNSVKNGSDDLAEIFENDDYDDVNNSGPSPSLKELGAGIAGGVVGGYLGGYLGGLILGSIAASNSSEPYAGLEGFALGFIVGGVAGVGVGAKVGVSIVRSPITKVTSVSAKYRF